MRVRAKASPMDGITTNRLFMRLLLIGSRHFNKRYALRQVPWIVQIVHIYFINNHKTMPNILANVI